EYAPLQDRAVPLAHQPGGLGSRGRAAARRAGGALRAGERRPEGVEQDPRGSGGRVGDDRVVDDVGVQRVEQRDTGAVPAGDVVDDDVVLQGHVVPLRRRIREARYLGAIDVLQGDTAAVAPREDRKSTRLNSSHRTISYAVFCLKKKKESTRENHC